jgi:hypothetical protein
MYETKITEMNVDRAVVDANDDEQWDDDTDDADTNKPP